MEIYFDDYNQPEQTRIYLGTSDNKIICTLNGIDEDSFDETINLNNACEISFDVNRFITDRTGKQVESNGYDLIDNLMRIYVDSLGWFILSPPVVSGDGIKEVKSLSAQSAEIEMMQHDLKKLKINCGTTDSYEMLVDGNVDIVGDVEFAKEQIKFYNKEKPELSFLNILLKVSGVYGWKIGYIDPIPKTYKYYEDGKLKERHVKLADEIGTFDIESQDLYSFLTQDVAQFFQCVFVFDFKNFIINVYRPENLGEDTNININFRNLEQSNEITVDENNMFTRYYVSGSDDLGISYVNPTGDNYIENLQSYLNEKYLPQDTIRKYKLWQSDVDLHRELYIESTRGYNKQQAVISELYNRVPLDDCSTDWSTFTDEELLEAKANYEAQKKGYESFYVDEDGNFDKEALDKSPDANDYYQIVDVILPSIQIEIDNREVQPGDEEDYIDSYKTNWKLYGLDELSVKLQGYKNTKKICEDSGYDTPYTEDSGHTKDYHEEMYEKYLDALNQLDPDFIGSCMETYNLRKSEIEKETEIQDSYNEERTGIIKFLAKETWKHYMEDTGETISFTSKDLYSLSKVYTDGDYSNENMFLTSSDDSVSAIDEQLKLLSAAEDDLYIASQKQYIYTTSLDNFLAKYEYRNYTNNLDRGDYIYLGIQDDYVVKLRVVSISYNPLKMDNNIRISFSNMIRSKSGRNDASYLFGSSVSGRKNTVSGSGGDYVTNEGIGLTSGLIQKLLASSAFLNKVTDITNNQFAGFVGGTWTTDELNANMIKVTEIVGENGFFEYLQSKFISTDKIVADSGIFKEVEAEVGKFKDMIAGNIGVENGYIFNLTAASATIDELFVKEGIAAKMTIADLKTYSATSEIITIVSQDGKPSIAFKNSTQQFYDSDGNVRVQIGQDAKNDFNFIVRGKDGTTALFDSNGITKDAIGDELIVNDMIQNGTLGEEKLNFPIIKPNDKGGVDITQIYDGKGELWGIQVESFMEETKSSLEDLEGRIDASMFTVVLSNEYQGFSVGNDRKPLSDMTMYTDVSVYKGSTERTDFVIGNIPSSNGISVSKTNSRVSFTISSSVAITADSGSFIIPITLDGITIEKKFSWSCTEITSGSDGKTSYIHVAYANSADGKTGFSTTDSSNKLYMGQYTDFSPTSSTDPTKYKWTLIKGNDGTSGKNNATAYLYQRKSSAPAKPTGVLTYTFATGVISGTLTNGWATTIPSGTDPLYVIIATASGSDATYSIPATAWSSPAILAQNGANGEPGASGRNVATAYLYQRATSTPSKPTASITYTFSTGTMTGTLGSWSTTIPSGTNPLYVITATASSTSNTYDIPATAWSSPVVLAQNGANGSTGSNGLNVATVYLYQRATSKPAKPSSALTYTFSTGALSGTLGSWSQTVPAGANPLYITLATASNTTATDSIAATEWSEPTIMAQNGEDGTVGAGGNLIKNGYGEYLDNTNFSGGTFTRGDCPEGCYGYFTEGQTELIPFDVNMVYTYDFYVRLSKGVKESMSYFGIAPYDVDGNLIGTQNVLSFNTSLFYLAKDLKNGDKVAYFKDLTEWKETTYDYNRRFIIFGYADSTGYVYPDGTYSRNVTQYDTYASDAAVDKVNHTITLKAAWTGGLVKAGTCVCPSSSGSNYCYYGQIGSVTNPSWSRKQGIIYAGNVGGGSSIDSRRLLYAKDIRLVLLTTYSGGGGTADFAKISIRERIGAGILSITEYYAVSSSNTTAPTAWKTDVPAMTAANKYLWNYEKITYSNNTTSETKKRVIGVYGENGAAGKGIQSVTNYYLATASSTGVTTSTAGWTTTVQSVSASKKYLWNYETVTFTDNTKSSTAPCIIGAYGDTGATGKPGTNGANAKSVTITATSQVFKSADGGKTFSPSTIKLTPVFQGGISYSKWQYSTNGGSSWTDVVSGSNGLTIASGALTIANNSALYTSSITSISFKCISSDANYFDITTVVKLYDVSEIEIGNRNILLKSGVQSKNSNYLVASYNTAIPLKVNTPYTVVFKGKTSASRTFDIYLLHSNAVCQRFSTNGTDTVYYANIMSNDKGTSRINAMYIYNNDGKGSEGTRAEGTIYWACLYEGHITPPLDWTPAPEDFENELTTIKSTISGVESTVNTVQKSITDKVWRTDVIDVVDKTGNPIKKSIKDILVQSTTDISGITSTVSSINTSVDKLNGDLTTINTKLTEIKQTADMITLLVKAGSTSSSIQLTPGAITAFTNSLVVKSPDGKRVVIEKGILSSDSVKSNNYATDSSGNVTAGSFLNLTDGSFKSKYLSWNSTGALTATSATISGNITATTLTATQTGNIACWTINSTSIYKGNSGFGVAGAGNMYFGNSGLSISNAFKVTNAGVLTATGATITGNITATAGKIGCWNINSSSIWAGNSAWGNAAGKYFGDSGLSLGSAFKVSSAGALTATNATITGNIDALEIKAKRGYSIYGINGNTTPFQIIAGEYVGSIRRVSIGTKLEWVPTGDRGAIPEVSGAGIEIYDISTTTGGVDIKGTVSVSSSLGVIGNITSLGKIDADKDITSGGNIYLGDKKAVFANVDNMTCKLVEISNSSNTTLGFGTYDISNGSSFSTNIYAGSDIKFITQSTGKTWVPYYRSGGGGSVTFRTAGYITSSKKQVNFLMPFSRPLIGEPKVTVTSVNGLRVRQGNKYLYGATASTWSKPSSYTTTIYGGGDGNGVVVSANMANDTDVVSNNDSCGIEVSISVKFT